MPSGKEIVTDFVASLRGVAGVTVAKSSLSSNVFKLSGSAASCLLYVKGRAESPYRWGVTANVVSRLKAQLQPWHVVLLFDSKESGYLLSAEDVSYYMNGVWPIGADGDFKPAPGSYLQRNVPFRTFGKFCQQVGMFDG